MMPNIMRVSDIHRFFRYPGLKFSSSEISLEFRIQKEVATEPLIFERILYWKRGGFYSVFPWSSDRPRGSKVISPHHELYETLTNCIIDYRLEN